MTRMKCPIPPHDRQVFVDAIAHARIQQLPEQTEWGQIIINDVNRSISLGLESTETSAKDVRREWLNELDSPTRRADRSDAVDADRLDHVRRSGRRPRGCYG